MVVLLSLWISQAFAITHGQVPAANDPIRAVAVELRDTRGKFACSGTRIARDIYITAAHCFLEGKPAFTIVVGEQSYQIRDHRVHPYYRTSQESATHDMAIFKTDPMPDDLTQTTAVLTSLPKPGTRVMMAGYGDVTGRERDTAGLHIAEFIMNESPGTGTAEIDGHVTTVDANGHTRTDITGVCEGDSGGSGYVLQDGRVELWGVDSESEIQYPHTHGSCAKREWVARIDYDLKWIEVVMGEFDAAQKVAKNVAPVSR